MIFARSSSEAKLQIADALRAEGHVVAMTGDGVNDPPALRREVRLLLAQIGLDYERVPIDIFAGDTYDERARKHVPNRVPE